MAIASVLSVYNITKAVDDRGNVITPQVKLEPGTIWYVASVAENCVRPDIVISHPAPFECVIKPRSEAALTLIQHAR
jgi:hypothetical protein